MYQCDCGKVFNKQRSLSVHRALWCTIHKDDLKYQCDCGEKFAYLRGKNGIRAHRKICPIWKKCKSERSSKQSKAIFQNMLKNEPEKIIQIKEKSALKISRTIMSNDNERKRRSKLLGELNKTDLFRARASETAKITSARPEIIAARSKRLQEWRINNPEEFKIICDNLPKFASRWIRENPERHYEECVKPMLSAWKSKPEKVLLKFCQSICSDFNNKHSIKHSSFTTKTKRRQIDIFSPSKNIIVEFDGPLHFLNIFGEENLKQKQQQYIEINGLKEAYCIIRVSYDKYNKKGFNNETLDIIRGILTNPVIGLHLIGNAYGENCIC